MLTILRAIILLIFRDCEAFYWLQFLCYIIVTAVNHFTGYSFLCYIIATAVKCSCYINLDYGPRFIWLGSLQI